METKKLIKILARLLVDAAKLTPEEMAEKRREHNKETLERIRKEKYGEDEGESILRMEKKDPDAFKNELRKLSRKATPESKEVLKYILKESDKIDWIDPEMLKKLAERFKDEPKVMTILHKAMKGNQDPYVGRDTHNISWRTKKDEPDIPFPLPAKVEEFPGVLGKDVPLGTGEPLMWMDSKYKISKNLIIKNQGKPLQINTRSDLIAHDDYIDVLDPSKHTVHMHIASLNDDFNKKTEPGAPSVLRRLKAATKLFDRGIKVVIVHDIFENKNLSKEMKEVNNINKFNIHSITKANIPLKENRVKLTDEQAHNLNDLAKVYKEA